MSSFRAVSINMPMSRSVARSRLHTSKPSSLGSIRSSTRRQDGGCQPPSTRTLAVTGLVLSEILHAPDTCGPIDGSPLVIDEKDGVVRALGESRGPPAVYFAGVL